MSFRKRAEAVCPFNRNKANRYLKLVGLVGSLAAPGVGGPPGCGEEPGWECGEPECEPGPG